MGEKHTVIAIDGPAGAGKSTAARALAKRLGLHMLDTGALFRAFGLYVLNAGLDPADQQACATALEGATLDIRMEGESQRTLLNGEDVSALIRTPEIAQAASTLGANPYVRRVLTEQVRRIAAKTSLVADGRDVGTAMLPNATVKFFLTAQPEERARRRREEQLANGLDEPLELVLQKIIARDEADSGRAIAPLCCAEDAVVVDSTDMDAEQVLNTLCAVIQERV